MTDRLIVAAAKDTIFFFHSVPTFAGELQKDDGEVSGKEQEKHQGVLSSGSADSAKIRFECTSDSTFSSNTLGQGNASGQGGGGGGGLVARYSNTRKGNFLTALLCRSARKLPEIQERGVHLSQRMLETFKS